MKDVDVDKIAKTERLTYEVLLKEVLPCHNGNEYFKMKKEEILSDLEMISWNYDLDEKVVIYCFIRLYNEGKAKQLQFMESFDFYSVSMLCNYVKHYYAELEHYQQLLWQ